MDSRQVFRRKVEPQSWPEIKRHRCPATRYESVPRLRHPHVLFVHARKHPSRFSTLGGRAVAVLNCRPLATSARLELAVLLRSGFPASPEPKHLEPVLLKTWHFPTNMNGGRDVPRLRHAHLPLVHVFGSARQLFHTRRSSRSRAELPTARHFRTP